tara:strand:- start:6177 stop:8408 length:2232 start_codon:yes stop_codon:yes gene_type:complete
MITRFASLSGRLLVAFALLFTVTACGGGGGGGGSFVPDQDGDDTYFLTLALVDANGNETNSLATGAPTTVTVKVTKNGKNGKVVADVVVNVVTTAGTISPASGTALTDSSGIATFRVQVDANTKGAGTLTASADNDTGTFTATLNFQIGSSGLRLGYLDSDGDFIENEIGIEPEAAIASRAVAQLSLVVLDENGDLAEGSQTVSFDSGCISSAQATLEPESPIVSGDGKINVSYLAAGCAGNDQITAALEGSTAQALGTVTIAAPSANGFVFLDAVPTTIVLRGTGGTPERTESSTVSFKVIDSDNSPVGGITVDFALTTTVGGMSLSSSSAISSSEGIVATNVISGDIPTVVRVIATVSAGDGTSQDVSTVSDLLTVTTGLPDQNSISISVGDGGFVVEEGMTVDGVTRTINVAMSDKFNNPVTDGTSAVFTTEYGSIQPSCETVDGVCSVIWRSQAPRFPTLTGSEFIKTITSTPYNCPEHNGNSGPCPSDLGFTRGGRSTILVTAIGEESFIDRNGNGIMDEDERDLFANLSEAFLDNNEDGIFNPATTTCEGAGAETPQCIAGQEEIFVDFNDNGRFDRNNNPALYNGLLCPPEGDGIWCKRELINVRDDIVVILSTPVWTVALYRDINRNPVDTTLWNGGSYTLYISDQFNNRLPAGSTVTLTGIGTCEVIGESSFTVTNVNSIGAFKVDNIRTGGEAVEGGEEPGLQVTVSPEGSDPVSVTYGCVPAPPPPPDPNEA